MEELTDGLQVESLPIVRDILDQAGAMMSSGVSGETVLITVVAVPVMLKLIDIARPYFHVHAEDKRAVIHHSRMEQLAALREKVGAEVFNDAMAAMNAGALEDPLPPPKKR